MIETRLALPVRSPIAVHRALHLASRRPRRRPACWRRRTRRRCGSGCRRATRSPQRPRHRARSPRRSGGGSDAPLVSHRTTVSAPASAAARRQSQRVVGVVAVAVEEVLGVVDDALARRDQEGDRLGDHRAGSRRGRRARPSRGAGAQVLPTSVQTGAKQSASTRSAVVLGGRARRAGASCRRRRSRRARSARCASSSKSSSSLGFEVGKPASIRCDAELVEPVRDAQLLGRAESDMPSPCMPSRRVVS